MTSDEAIRIFLSRNPVQFTITDIADNLGYHRNTTKKAIKRIDDVENIGSGNYTRYFIKSMIDHYREVGEAIRVSFSTMDPDISYTPGDTFENLKETRLWTYMRSFGYALVKENLEDTITQEYINNYDHITWEDNLIHLKMSYPFEDIIEIADGEGNTSLHSSVNFYLIHKESIEGHVSFRVKTCICRGEKKTQYLCGMVAGALQAGLNFACQKLDSKIEHHACEPDGSCIFNIVKSETSEEDETFMEDLL